MALEESGEGHFCSVSVEELDEQRLFRIDLAVQAVDVGIIRRVLEVAHISKYVDVLILCFYEDLSFHRCAIWVRSQSNSSKCLQELCKGEQMLRQYQVASTHSPHQAIVHLLEESKDKFATHGLAFVGPVFLPREGLVLDNVEGR